MIAQTHRIALDGQAVSSAWRAWHREVGPRRITGGTKNRLTLSVLAWHAMAA
jgi:hypothetical protein